MLFENPVFKLDRGKLYKKEKLITGRPPFRAKSVNSSCALNSGEFKFLKTIDGVAMNSVVVISKKISSIWICIVFLLSSIFFSVSVFAFEKTFTNSLGMEFVLIPSGTFMMGSPPGEPDRDLSEVRHRITISKPFYMQTTEVTLKQWRSLMKSKLLIFRNASGDMPVTRVSWFDCMEFIKRLNGMGEGKYRLPTEAEWEYAARAGTTTAFSWGDSIDCEKAMYGNNSIKYDVCQLYIESIGLRKDQPAPAKTYRPNPWGLYDMHGNLWEWCQDWFGDYEKNPATDPKGPASGTMRIRRGGSWFKYGYSCRSANATSQKVRVDFIRSGFAARNIFLATTITMDNEVCAAVKNAILSV